MKKRLCAGGLVVKPEGKDLNVLLIQDRYGHWTLPKGKIEKAETAEEAALRETREETGLKRLRLVERVGETSYEFTSSKGKPIHKTVQIFLIVVEGEEGLVIQKEEICDARWWSPEEAMKRIGYENLRGLLAKAIASLPLNSPR